MNNKWVYKTFLSAEYLFRVLFPFTGRYHDDSTNVQNINYSLSLPTLYNGHVCQSIAVKMYSICLFGLRGNWHQWGSDCGIVSVLLDHPANCVCIPYHTPYRAHGPEFSGHNPIESSTCSVKCFVLLWMVIIRTNCNWSMPPFFFLLAALDVPWRVSESSLFLNYYKNLIRRVNNVHVPSLFWLSGH